MSLLIKALDKAQAEKAKAEAANGKSIKNEPKKEKQAAARRHKKLKVKKTKVDNEVSDLSLSPPKENLIGAEKNLTKQKATAAEPMQRRAARALTIEPAIHDTESPVAMQKPSHVQSSPVASAVNPSIPTSSTATLNTSATSAPTPIQAANIFSAKHSQEETNGNSTLLLIVAAGLIAMIAMGVYYYQFVDSSPDIVVPQRQVAIKTTPVVLPETQQEPLVAEEVLAEEEDDQNLGNTMQDDEAEVETNVFAENKTGSFPIAKVNEVTDVENTLEPNEVLARSSIDLEETSFVHTKKIIVSESASIQVIKNQKKPSISPVLMRAYTAYQAGNDHEARSSYKEVLRADGLNVDAMLGLGAIATRQGRVADANDWYQRVLRLEPRNDTAKTALLYSQAQRNPQIGDESHIKSMIAQSPNDSSLHAALGDFYIKQNQWPPAQQAYFDAYRLNNSADNAFNLAVSLDQMAKPKLALPYYQQALKKAEQSQNTSIDMAALQARIHSIQ